MASITKKNILVAVLLVVLSGAAVGYYLYNKGPLDVRNSAAVNTTASSLYD